MKTGLVLEGGGVRGIYTAGVLDVFMDRGLTFDGLIGVSAGAIHGCSFLSNQKGRSLRYYKKYVSDPRFMSFQSLIKTGDLVGADFCYHELPDKLDIYNHDAFLANPTPFWAVCTDVESGEAAYIRITDMRAQIDVLRASASLPFCSRIVEIDGRGYLDGGCTDSIPVEQFRKMGYGKNVVVLTQPADYRKKPMKAAMIRLFYRRIPKFAAALSRRHIRYKETVARILELEKDGDIFVIRPGSPLEVGRLEKDPEKVQQVYNRGRADAIACMERLNEWLNK